MSAETPTCDGVSATGGVVHACAATPKYRLTQPMGSKERVRHACGRHLTAVLDRITVPGRAATVTRLS